MCRKKLIRTFLVVFLALSPCVSLADEYKYLSISFLGRKIGTIEVREVSNIDSKEIHVNGKISSSPFKMFNGAFKYKTTFTKINSGASQLHYERSVNATFKERKINYRVKNNRLVAVEVFPKREETKFTNPKRIDFDFIDPAYAIIKLLSTPCKGSFKVYDGRRLIDIIAIEPTSKLKCGYVYKIEKGPGHLSPFNFKTFKILTFFDQHGNSANRTMTVKAGPFKLILNRGP